MKIKPVIYVAAPFTEGDQFLNVKHGVEVGQWVFERGGIPFIPHLNAFFHIHYAKTYEDWLNYCLFFVRRSNALLYSGLSKGVNVEINFAHKLNIPVYNFDHLKNNKGFKWNLVEESILQGIDHAENREVFGFGC